MNKAGPFSVTRLLAHDGAVLHVSGEALHVDDIATSAGTVFFRMTALAGQSICQRHSVESPGP
ncbi:MAG: hypothetical protein ACR2QF_16255 [Geminicoccaceae bacterium]